MNLGKDSLKSRKREGTSGLLATIPGRSRRRNESGGVEGGNNRPNNGRVKSVGLFDAQNLRKTLRNRHGFLRREEIDINVERALPRIKHQILIGKQLLDRLCPIRLEMAR